MDDGSANTAGEKTTDTFPNLVWAGISAVHPKLVPPRNLSEKKNQTFAIAEFTRKNHGKAPNPQQITALMATNRAIFKHVMTAGRAKVKGFVVESFRNFGISDTDGQPMNNLRDIKKFLTKDPFASRIQSKEILHTIIVQHWINENQVISWE